MDTDDIMTDEQQDEGRIDPQQDDSPFVGGISEFARLEEEREQLLEQGVPEEDLEQALNPEVVQIDGEFVPEVPLGDGGEAAFKALQQHAEDRAVEEHGGVPSDFYPENAKATNPKDAVATGKAPLSYLPIPVLYEAGLGMLEGARKYGGHNYRSAGVRSSVYFNATLRHLMAWYEGEDIDPDSGIHHVTKAITSLMVLRDAQMQGMVKNDDRPISANPGWLAEIQEKAREIVERYPDPVPDFTQAEVAHLHREPINVYGNPHGQAFTVEVQLPADDSTDGFVWMQQGSDRDTLEQALAVAQALRDDGYDLRVVRIVRTSERIEEFADGMVASNGTIKEVVRSIFPGDPAAA